MEHDPLHTTQKLLEGYSVTEWPDLSCERAPPLRTHSSTSSTLANFSPAIQSPALLLVAIARILGVYCGSCDILMGFQSSKNSNYWFARISWSDNQTWREVVANVVAQLNIAFQKGLSLTTFRRVLGMSEKQFPCLAIVGLTPTNKASSTEFPVSITYTAEGKTLTLSGPETLLHPSISEQILAQVVVALHHAVVHLDSPVASNSQFPPELMSIRSRVSEEEISLSYPHLPVVTFATEYLTRRAESNPNSTAVEWFPELTLDVPSVASQRITYSELDRKACQVARWLVSKGLNQEDRVGVCLPRDLLFHAALVGIMRAGGCYVPIDPELPLERKVYIANDSNATFVLTSRALSSPDLFGLQTVYIDDGDVQNAIEQQDGGDFNIANPDGLVYMLYTSGTTGNPKGCLLTNRGLAQAILALSSTAADVRMEDLNQGHYLAVASIAFDVHIGETIVPIALGMPLISAPRSQLLEDLPRYVKLLGITHLGIVPSLIEATLNAATDEEGGISLRYIASGGEKMSDSILDKWANHPQVRLANFYGPSEVTIGCCARYMSSSTTRRNIGRPLANVSGYVVDADLNILPRGGIGELVVEGPLVGRGYHNRPELTGKVFMQWPNDGCWAYRTGDLVRMMPDSTLEILGRIDTQIKLRGVRIESEGISAIVRKGFTQSVGTTLDATTILAKHPAIGSEQLVSFISWDPSVPIATRKSTRPKITIPPAGMMKSIRAVCTSELASYMRPSHVIPLSWLPLNANGKTDAKILVDMFKLFDVNELANLLLHDEDSHGLSECTKRQLETFSILKRHAPSYPQKPYPELSIFECGLDSMAIIRFTSDLNSALKTRVSASDVMKGPKLVDIGKLVERGTNSGNLVRNTSHPMISPTSIQEVYSAYTPSNIQDILPPFPIQEGVLSRSAELDGLYVQHVLLECRQNVSLPDLERSLNAVVARHPILRTVFYIDRVTLQIVLKEDTFPSIWSVESLAVSEKDSFEEMFYRNYATSIAKDINHSISIIPPFRLVAFQSTTATFLVVSMHHTIYDGICLPLLLSDLERAYLGSQPLPVASLHDILYQIATKDLDAARDFWTGSFTGFSWPNAAFDESCMDLTETRRTDYLSVSFANPLSFIKGIATKNKVTFQALISYVFANLIASRLYHCRDVCFGVIRSGRLLPVENIDVAMCPMVSVLPMRVNLQDMDSTLQTIQSGISAMVEYEHIPLGQVQSWLRPGERLFEVLFSASVQDHPSTKIWDVINGQPPQADYPLSVEVVIDNQDDALFVRAAWLHDYLSEGFVSELLQAFEATALSIGINGALPPEVANGAIAADKAGRLKGIDASADSDLPVDPVVLESLREVITSFLTLPTGALTETVSFISLGLDSIKAVGLAKRIRKVGYEVSSAQLLKLSTLRRLAQDLSGRRVSPKEHIELLKAYTDARQQLELKLPIADVKLSFDDDPRIFPATALQAGMLSQTIGSGGSLYIHAFPMSMAEGTDIYRLRAAWKSVVSCLEILRTSFHFIQDLGLWAQVVHKSTTLDWSTQSFDTEDNYIEKLEAYVRSIKCEDELAFSTPPIWLRLFTPNTSSGTSPLCRLVLVMHHALYDGASVEHILNTVESAYHGKPLPSPVQFTDLLPQFFHQETEGTAFWLKRLHGFRPTLLPAHRLQGPSPHHIQHRKMTVDSSQLSNMVRTAGVTPQCLLQGALSKLLASVTKSSDVVFGQVVSGRSIPGAEEAIGPILNTIPCRVHIKSRTSNTELLQSIHHANVSALRWQQASLRGIQKALGVERMWDCLFTFQPLAKASFERRLIWKMDMVDQHDIEIQYPLHVEIEQEETGFCLRCACRSDVFTNTQLSTFVRELEAIIQGFLSHPTAPADDSPNNPPLRRDHPVHTDEHLPSSSVERSIELEIPPALLSAIQSFASGVRLSPDTPLTALGIDSITAIQISGKCREGGFKLSASDILNSRSLKDLIVKLNRGSGAIATERQEQPALPQELSMDEKAAISRRFIVDAGHIKNISIPSSGMKWLIGGWQCSHGSQFQHIFSFCLPTTVDATRLKNAWHMLVKRHEILRSTFASAAGSSEPRIVTFSPLYEFKHWQEESIEDASFFRALLSKMHELACNPPPISRPPVQATLFRSPTHAYLILQLHHFQYDAWSLQLLVNDLSCLYNVLEPPSVIDSRSFLSFFSSSNHNVAVQQRYWKAVFPPDFRPSLFPALSTRPILNPNSRKRTVVTMPSVLAQASRYEARARMLGLSLQAVLLAAWAQLQASHSATSSSTFGLWQAGRSGPIDGIERLAIPCMNVLPMHVLLDGPILEVAKSIQVDLQGRTSVIEQSDLVRIAEWIGIDKTPIFNVCVNIVKVPHIWRQDLLLEPVKAPYFVPDISLPTTTPTLDELAISRVVQNDLMIDIAILEKDDSVLMSVDAAYTIMSDEQAVTLIHSWRSMAESALTTI